MRVVPRSPFSWQVVIPAMFLVAIFGVCTLFAKPVEAATLGDLRLYLNRQLANVASGLTVELVFTPVGNVSGGAGQNSVLVLFPDGHDGQWCRTAGALTVTGIASPTGVSEGATVLPGTLVGACSAGSGSGSADANRDRLVITGVDDLTAGTRYGVRVSGGVGVLGTATTAGNVTVELATRDNSALVDTGTFAPVALTGNDQITVTATVPSATPPETPVTAVTLRGIAYPSSTVTVMRDNVVAVQVPADPQARFDITIGSLSAGSYTFGVYSADTSGRQGPTSNFTVTLTTGTTVTITGIFLGPTIAADKTAVGAGETITLLGTTSPSSDVHIFVSSDAEQEFTAQASGAGAWSKQLLASELNVGTHTARSKAEDPSGAVSEYSNSVSFTVASVADPDAGYLRADINKDRRVDLIDFSILLFYWNQRNPANVRADINRDGVVNIVDFSIMLFYWTAKPV